MKAEERHELQENDLASWLQYGLWAFLRQNGSYVLLVLAFSFLGYQLWSLYERKQLDTQRNAWDELRAADMNDNPFSAVQGVIDKYDIKPVQAQARLKLGIMYDRLIAWPEELNTRKLTRQAALDIAFDNYKKVLELSDDNLILGKAHLGLATIHEDRGSEWDLAKKEYEILADPKGRFAGSPFITLAEDRLKTMDDRKMAPPLAAMIPPPALPKPLLTPDDLGIKSGSPSNTPNSSQITVPGMGGGGLFGGPTSGSILPGILNQPFGPSPEAPKNTPPSPFGITPQPATTPASR